MTTSRPVRADAPPRVRAGTEILLVAVLYVGYSASRLLAADDPGAAARRAQDLLSLERSWGLDVEGPLNRWFASVDALGVGASFWYATTHYVVTLLVLVWLFRRRPGHYRSARRVIVLASLLGLALYLLVPTAPPRFLEGYTDVLDLHAGIGWWGADASAPRGFGHLTNELAAFPSLHAGWALWVALAVRRAGAPRGWRIAAWLYAGAMALVVIGTGNHWTLDVVGGWAVVLVAAVVVEVAEAARRPGRPRVPTLEA